MPIPKFDEFALPLLTFLGAAGSETSAASLFEHAAQWAKLSDEDREVRQPGGQPVYKNRAGWALTWMRHCGWVENPRRGRWAITSAGKKRLLDLAPITAAEMRPFSKRSRGEGKVVVEAVDRVEEVLAQTPEDRIEDALNELHAEVSTQILALLKARSPLFFEEVVIEILRAAGYVGKQGGTRHTGKSGDGGVDGELWPDRLGLDRILVQCKRYDASVGPDEVRSFLGAMDNRRAMRGVFATTGTFTKQARLVSEHATRTVRLIDGTEIAMLMIELSVGVQTTRAVALPKLDLDFFDE